MHRRGFLALAGTGAVCGPLVAVSGCLSQPNGETTTQTTTTQTASESHAPEPTAALPTITTYPFRFDRSVAFATGGSYGWFFDGSFTKAVNLAGSVTDGDPISIYITEENLEEATPRHNHRDTKRNDHIRPGGCRDYRRSRHPPHQQH